MAYAVIVGSAAAGKLRGFATDDFDLAVHTQSLHNLVHGRLDCSLLGIPFLGNHMVLVLFLLAPLYAALPSAMLLVVLQTIALASGAWAVWLLGRRQLSPGWTMALCVAYLAHPALALMNLYEFHPVALATPLMLFMLWAYEARRPVLYGVCIALTLACQENLSMIVAAMGIYAALQRRRPAWVLPPLLAGTAYFVIVILFVMPDLNQNTIQFLSLYGHLGDSPAAIIGGIARHPVAAASTAFAPGKRQFLNVIFGPLGYISLLNPTALFPLLPVAAQRLLSARASESSILYHYQAEFIPFVFFAAVGGARRLLGLRRPNGRLILILVLAVFPLSGLIGTGVPARVTGAITASEHDRAMASLKRSIVRSVPDDARVLATFTFLPHLSNRPGLYSLHHVYTGQYTLSHVPYPTPEVDTVILDTHDWRTFFAKGFYAPHNYRRLQALLERPGWELTTHEEGMLVFERCADDATGRVERLAAPVESGALPFCEHAIVQNMQAPLQLLDFEMGTPNERGVADLILYWRWADTARTSDLGARITLSDPGGDLRAGVLYPGSRICPPQSWPPDKVIRDRHRIRIERNPAAGAKLELRVELVPADE